MKKNKIKFILLIILIVLFSLITYLIKTNHISNFDNFIYNSLDKIMCVPLTNFFKVVTNFANYIVIIILCVVSFIISKNKWYGVFVSVDAINSTIINKILKSIFVRPRPEILRLVNESGYSFPSGHAMASFSFYGFIIYLIYRSNIQNKYKKILYIFLSLIILLIGISRIYLGVHYASDVLAGYIMAGIHLIIYTYLIEKLQKMS